MLENHQKSKKSLHIIFHALLIGATAYSGQGLIYFTLGTKTSRRRYIFIFTKGASSTLEGKLYEA